MILFLEELIMDSALKKMIVAIVAIMGIVSIAVMSIIQGED